MYIPAYCTINFLEETIKRQPFDFVSHENPQAGKTHYELLELIKDGLSIKTDCKSEVLAQKGLQNPYIKYLMKNGRINCATADFQAIQENCHSFFEKTKHPTCLYLLTNCNAMLAEYTQKSGQYFLSLESAAECLFKERIQTFSVDESVNWEFAKHYFEPHHSIVIADPYLYKSQEAVAKLLENILPQKMTGQYHIAFILSDKQKKDGLPGKLEIHKWVNQLSVSFNKKVKVVIEYYIYNGEDFHDRVIVTNNACIFSGIGFGMMKYNAFRKSNVSKKETTWIGFKPFKRLSTNNNNYVLVYKLMQDSLRVFKGWIAESDRHNIQNPLLNQSF